MDKTIWEFALYVFLPLAVSELDFGSFGVLCSWARSTEQGTEIPVLWSSLVTRVCRSLRVNHIAPFPLKQNFPVCALDTLLSVSLSTQVNTEMVISRLNAMGSPAMD